MLETFLQYLQRILVAPLVHNNNQLQTRQVIYLALLQRHSILQRMRVKVDWRARVLQVRELMISSALMLRHNNNSSHKCSRIKPQLLKLIILSQVIYWTYFQQTSHLAAMISSLKTNLTISSLQITSHWPLHKTKSLIMTNTLSSTASTNKISSSSNSLQEQQALVGSKINSRLRATCRALTPSAS